MLSTDITTATACTLSDPAPEIKTNIPRDVRIPLIRWFDYITRRVGFVRDVGLRLQMTEMFLNHQPYEAAEKQARIVWEIDVGEGQLT